MFTVYYSNWYLLECTAINLTYFKIKDSPYFFSFLRISCHLFSCFVNIVHRKQCCLSFSGNKLFHVMEVFHCFRHIFRLLLDWARNIKEISRNFFNENFSSFVWKCSEEYENVNKWIKKTSVVHFINIW